MFENLYNQAIPRLEKAFKHIANGDVVLLEYGRAVVHSGSNKYHVNYTSEKCECEDYIHRKAKCGHIWAAQLKQQQVSEIRTK